MPIKKFLAEHINATEDDLAGNNGVGRYVLLPGSEGRAKEIAGYFDNVTVKSHHRSHNLYMGTIACQDKNIEVATVATGMGCPSTEIILHELYDLGAKRFLRIGTAGSLQKDWLRMGSFVNAQATVRDENTTTAYAPIEFPAIASFEFASCILIAAERLGLSEKLHTGIVHCKSSLYAREFGAGPLAAENKAYLNKLSQMGVLASEMETAALFIQSQLYNHQLSQQGSDSQHRVLAGAILAILDAEQNVDNSGAAKLAIQNAIELGLQAIKTLAIQEVFG